jgi:hypothetical protein
VPASAAAEPSAAGSAVDDEAPAAEGDTAGETGEAGETAANEPSSSEPGDGGAADVGDAENVVPETGADPLSTAEVGADAP